MNGERFDNILGSLSNIDLKPILSIIRPVPWYSPQITKFHEEPCQSPHRPKTI